MIAASSSSPFQKPDSAQQSAPAPMPRQASAADVRMVTAALVAAESAKSNGHGHGHGSIAGDALRSVSLATDEPLASPPTHSTDANTESFGTSHHEPAAVPQSHTKSKIVFLGDASVGKTSIIARFLYDTFDQHYAVTVGIDFISKTMVTPTGRRLKLQIWDTAGQERFRSLIPSYLRDSDCVVLVFDVSSRDSFLSLSRWIEDVKRDRGDSAMIVLVANKIDCDSEKRQVPHDEIAAFAKSQFLDFFETSAATNIGIADLFHSIAGKLPQIETSERAKGFGSATVENVTLNSANNSIKSQSSYCAC